MDIAGVDADGGEDFRKLLSDLKVRAAVIEICGDTDDTSYARCMGARDEIWQLGSRKFMRSEVAMRIGEHERRLGRSGVRKRLLLHLSGHEIEGIGAGRREVFFQPRSIDECHVSGENIIGGLLV